MYLYPEIMFLDHELDPLARALSELLSCDFNHVADRMSQLSDEEPDVLAYLKYAPAERVTLIHIIVRDMVASGKFDRSKQEDWAGVCAGVLFPYVYTHLRNAVVGFAKQFDVAINYLAYHDRANPYDPFGHDVRGACYHVIIWLEDAGAITAAAFCDMWHDGHIMRMIDVLGLDSYEDMFVRARALQHSSLEHYTFADIEYELTR